MKKRVGILTTHRANNFGAMLQAHSLVAACREMGADAEIIDWRCPHFEKLYQKAWRMHRNPIPAIKHLLFFLRDEKPARKMFETFRSQFPMGAEICSRRELARIEDAYDIFIVGSDQVWNPINSATDPLRFDRANLLDFVHVKKKYAYAASIGATKISPDILLPEFIDAWKSFDGITMRESAGAEYVGKCIGKKVQQVADPVLLHDAGFWRKIESPVQKGGRFVFVYNIRGFGQLDAKAKELAGREGLEIVDMLIPALTRQRGQGKVAAGPREFLSYLDKAEYVVTDSFHASAFSVIFGKKLYLQYNLRKGNSNSRMDTLFSMASIPGSSIVDDGVSKLYFYDCGKKETDKLDTEVKRSLDVLSKMIGGTYEM